MATCAGPWDASSRKTPRSKPVREQGLRAPQMQPPHRRLGTTLWLVDHANLAAPAGVPLGLLCPQPLTASYQQRSLTDHTSF